MNQVITKPHVSELRACADAKALVTQIIWVLAGWWTQIENNKGTFCFCFTQMWIGHALFHSGEEVSVITAGQVESDAFQQHQVLVGG